LPSPLRRARVQCSNGLPENVLRVAKNLFVGWTVPATGATNGVDTQLVGIGEPKLCLISRRLIDPDDPAYPHPPPNSLTRQQTLEMIDKANPGARKRAREQFRVERSERRRPMELDIPTSELERRRCNAARGDDC
jgi:hypothetical protein